MVKKWSFVKCDFSIFFLTKLKKTEMTKIVFYVLVFDQIRISICQSHQNDNQNLSFMRNNNVVAKKMARNGLKIANSLGYAFHFESDFICFKNSYETSKIKLWNTVMLTFVSKKNQSLARDQNVQTRPVWCSLCNCKEVSGIYPISSLHLHQILKASKYTFLLNIYCITMAFHKECRFKIRYFDPLLT